METALGLLSTGGVGMYQSSAREKAGVDAFRRQQRDQRFLEENKKVNRLRLLDIDTGLTVPPQKPRHLLVKNVVEFLREVTESIYRRQILRILGPQEYQRETEPPGYKQCSAEDIRIGSQDRIDINALNLRLLLEQHPDVIKVATPEEFKFEYKVHGCRGPG